eukprot:365585-Chlamydomonas_euryale.AAC.4
MGMARQQLGTLYKMFRASSRSKDYCDAEVDAPPLPLTHVSSLRFMISVSSSPPASGAGLQKLLRLSRIFSCRGKQALCCTRGLSSPELCARGCLRPDGCHNLGTSARHTPCRGSFFIKKAAIMPLSHLILLVSTRSMPLPASSPLSGKRSGAGARGCPPSISPLSHQRRRQPKAMIRGIPRYIIHIPGAVKCHESAAWRRHKCGPPGVESRMFRIYVRPPYIWRFCITYMPYIRYIRYIRVIRVEPILAMCEG